MNPEGWSSYPWEKSEDGSAWHKHGVPYCESGNNLQNLDVWIPATLGDRPSPSFVPTNGGSWIIYVHGGAWRDPLVSASSFMDPVKHLLSRRDVVRNIAGLASLNYSLSPHPQHSTDPSPPRDPTHRQDPSRMAKHPDHIRDILMALRYLQREIGFGNHYILLGHSCGATLAFQVAMERSKWHFCGSIPSVEKPRTIVGLNGLYDIPGLIDHPGEKHDHLIPVYRAFTKLAFGDDLDDWQIISPISVRDWCKEWTEGTRVVLVQSHGDSLVPYEQTKTMLRALSRSKSIELTVTEMGASGDHNDIWANGERLAEIISEIVETS